jgi:type IV pilus assembly protein PilO
MFEKMPFYGQVLIFAGMALGIIGVAYYIAPNLKETRATIAQLEEDYQEKDREITKGRAIEQRLPEFEREIANLQQKLTDVQQILPTNRETGDLLRWIKNLGDQSNLDLKSFSPGALRPMEFYKEFPIEMQVVARYHDLGIFLDRVSKYSRIINVDNLRINSTQDGDKTIRAGFTATTFVYDDTAAGQAQVAEEVQ